jgi:hypothetical protein
VRNLGGNRSFANDRFGRLDAPPVEGGTRGSNVNSIHFDYPTLSAFEAAPPFEGEVGSMMRAKQQFDHPRNGFGSRRSSFVRVILKAVTEAVGEGACCGTSKQLALREFLLAAHGSGCCFTAAKVVPVGRAGPDLA